MPNTVYGLDLNGFSQSVLLSNLSNILPVLCSSILAVGVGLNTPMDHFHL